MLLPLRGVLLLTTFVGDDYPPSMVYVSNTTPVLILSTSTYVDQIITSTLLLLPYYLVYF